MAVTFTEADSIGDVLDVGRYHLKFPTVAGINGSFLSLHHADVEIPANSLAQIQYRAPGSYPIGFAGGYSHENTMTVSFYDTYSGYATKSIKRWLEFIVGNNGLRSVKSSYAVGATLEVYDTINAIANSFTLYNVFPITLTHPSFSEESGPYKVSVIFNVDGVALSSLQVTAQGIPSYNTTSISGLSSLLTNGLDLALGNATSLSVGFGGVSATLSTSIGSLLSSLG